MRATPFEYRFRFAIHAIIFGLGFWSPWLSIPSLDWTHKSLWLVLATQLFRHGWLTFSSATIAVLAWALLTTGLGAWMRLWGSAYLGAGVVMSHNMHGQVMQADGPFRHTRNPLYLGTLLHTLGIAILMPPSGALFAVTLIWLLQVRLALAEEPFLTAKFGQPYRDFCARVPRFVPALTPQVPAAGARPHWLQALAGELYFPAVFLVLAIFGWSFNANPIQRGILIALGAWLIALALIPRPRAATV